jgi:hypothetical protein
MRSFPDTRDTIIIVQHIRLCHVSTIPPLIAPGTAFECSFCTQTDINICSSKLYMPFALCSVAEFYLGDLRVLTARLS